MGWWVWGYVFGWSGWCASLVLWNAIDEGCDLWTFGDRKATSIAFNEILAGANIQSYLLRPTSIKWQDLSLHMDWALHVPFEWDWWSNWFDQLQGVSPTRQHLDTHMEPRSRPNTAVKSRPEEARRPKQKCRNISQESPRLSLRVHQTLNPDV
jgi:hypothetical protein